MTEVLLVTGAAGFVGRRLLQHLARSKGQHLKVVTWAHDVPPNTGDVQTYSVDIRDADAVRKAVSAVRPSAVIHLAASARSSYNRTEVGEVWRVNLHGTLNIAHALLELAPSAWLLNVSSGMVYGAAADAGPVSETAQAAPTGAYSGSKYAAEVALQELAIAGLNFATARPFNHSGPGQGPDFFVPAFIKRVLAHKGESPGVLRVRNMGHMRDYLHVDDVVQCYTHLYDIRAHIPRGLTANVSSGEGVTVGQIAEYVLELAGMNNWSIEPEATPQGDDPAQLVGRNDLIRDLGWTPTCDWRVMVRDAFDSMAR